MKIKPTILPEIKNFKQPEDEEKNVYDQSLLIGLKDIEEVDENMMISLIDQASRDLDAGKEVGKSTQQDGVWP